MPAAIRSRRRRNCPRHSPASSGQGARWRGAHVMRHLAGWAVLAGLMGLAAAAYAQTVVPVSDFVRPGPYAAMPADVLWPGYGPRLLPPHEVAAIAHERGFAPLGSPQQRGIVYTMSVIDPDG